MQFRLFSWSVAQSVEWLRDEWMVRVSKPSSGKIFVSSPKCRYRHWSPPRVLFQNYWGFPGVKQLGCEANHSLGSSAKAKNEWSYTATPLIYLLGTDMENFTFTIIAGIRHVTVKTWENSCLCFTNVIILQSLLLVEHIIQSWKIIYITLCREWAG
jgi:hypothetical protein